MEVCSNFIQGDPRKAWDGFMQLIESYSSSSSSIINSSSSNVLKDRNGKLLCTPQDLVDRFGEHYEALASDITGHSLDPLNGILMVRSSWMRARTLYD